MTTVDARGLSCPEPVLVTKKAFASGESEYTVIVDNATAFGNVSRFISKAGYNSEHTLENGEYTIIAKKG